MWFVGSSLFLGLLFLETSRIFPISLISTKSDASGIGRTTQSFEIQALQMLFLQQQKKRQQRLQQQKNQQSMLWQQLEQQRQEELRLHQQQQFGIQFGTYGQFSQSNKNLQVSA